MENPNKNTWGSEDITFGQEPVTERTKSPESELEFETDPNPVVYAPNIQEHEIIFDNQWLKVKKAGNHIYSQRKGIDSIAFIFIAINASDEKRIGLIHEFKESIGSFLTTAFGGSIDDEKYHKNLKLLVKDEAMEEAGFDIKLSQIQYHGKTMVSTQSNQFCHLFSIEVNKMDQGDKTTKNPSELKSTVSWLSMPEIKDVEDWKSQTIILRRMMAKNGLVFVSTPKTDNIK